MKLKGHLQVTGSLKTEDRFTSKGKVVLQGGVQGFYLPMAEDVGNQQPANNQVLKFNTSTGQYEPGDESGSINFTDGSNTYTNPSELNFNDADFYLSGSADSPATPVVNLLNSPPRVTVRQVSGFNIDRESTTSIQFDTEEYDIGDWFNTAGDTDLTVPEPGYYHASGFVSFDESTVTNGGTGVRRFVGISVNSANTTNAQSPPVTGAISDTRIFIASDLKLNAGDTLNLTALQDVTSGVDDLMRVTCRFSVFKFAD